MIRSISERDDFTVHRKLMTIDLAAAGGKNERYFSLSRKRDRETEKERRDRKRETWRRRRRDKSAVYLFITHVFDAEYVVLAISRFVMAG